MLRVFSPSSHNSPTTDSISAAPFVLELRSLDLQTDGTFTPDAAVLLTPALMESGLLLHLSPVELQTLLLVLSGVTSNGSFVTTSEGLASYLRLWPGQMRARLERLTARCWNGEPLLRCQTTESGLRLFAPSPALFEVRQILVFPAAGSAGERLERPAALQEDGARVIGGLREEIVQHSRATYTRPRAEVEAEINRFLSREPNSKATWPGSPSQASEADASPGKTELKTTQVVTTEVLTPEENAKHALGRRLITVGLSVEQARFIVDGFPQDLIERQLQYLPYRRARNPTGMLVASIEGDYAPPPGLRLVPAPKQPSLSAPEGGIHGDGNDEGELTQAADASTLPGKAMSEGGASTARDPDHGTTLQGTTLEMPPDV